MDFTEADKIIDESCDVAQIICNLLDALRINSVVGTVACLQIVAADIAVSGTDPEAVTKLLDSFIKEKIARRLARLDKEGSTNART